MRNLLLLLEPTQSGIIAADMACEIAGQGNCSLTGLQIDDMDAPAAPAISIRPKLCAILGEPGTGTSDDAVVWSPQGVKLNEKLLRGPRFALLSQETEVHDLTLIGREGNFEEHPSRSAKEIITLLLKYRASPLVIAPSVVRPATDILITYDGSPRASRAIRFLALLGLAQEKRIHVLCIDRKRRVAEAKAALITAYLERQKAGVIEHAVESRANTSEVIFDKIKELDTSLVVSGALASSGWRRGLIGSVSDYLIRHCPAPLFTCP